MAHFAQLIPLDELADVIESSGENMMGTPAPLLGTPYALKQGPFVSPMFTPCLAPPWSALVAVDLAAGEILWQSTLGMLDTLMPVPLPLKWGTASFGGPIITAGGLVFHRCDTRRPDSRIRYRQRRGTLGVSNCRPALSRCR